jgi:ABC-type transporter Mla subunit MlaD
MAPNTSTPPAGNHSPLPGSPDITKTAQTAIVDIATKAKAKAQAVAQAAADTVDQNRGTAARVLANAASTIHDAATRLPGGEGVTRLAETAAEEIDATAQYVREHNTQQMMADLKQFVRRHPGASVVGAAVLGIFVGRGLFRNIR